MRVLLIWPDNGRDIIGWGDLGAIAEPLALEYLAAAMDEAGHEVKLLDLRLHGSELTSTVSEWRPHIVGVTGYSMHVPRMLEICRTVREELPGCATVVGGHHATLSPDDFFDSAIDYVVCGEGVKPLTAITENILNGRPNAPVPGTWLRSSTGHVFGGAPGYFDVESLPRPNRSVCRKDRSEYFIDWMRPIALLRTSVGCPYRCSFCSLWRMMDGRYHRRAIDRVVEELEEIDEDFVFLVDDEAFINERRMLALARIIEAAGIRKNYFAYCRADTLLRNKDAIAAWRRIGLERLFIGFEAVTDEGLGGFSKSLSVAQIDDALGLAGALGIKVFSQFIVDPQFTRSDFQRLERFIERRRIDYPSFTILTPLPGSGMSFDHVTERTKAGRPRWDLFDLQNPVTPTALPREDFMREYRGLQKLFSHSLKQQHTPNSQRGW